MTNDHRLLTTGQKSLGTAILLLALAATPVFFIVMFLTVNGMLGPDFDGWAWTVPVATEITFTLLFLWAVFMEWIRRPRAALWIAPYPFAGMSAFLNVWATHGSIPGMAGHLAVTLAFFTPVTFAKMGVRAMLVTDDERTRAAARADARAHARDMLRSALGIWWRFRAPVLLRRQLRSRRLPAKVLEAVSTGDATSWEQAVEDWITASVTVTERTAALLRAARAEADTSTPAALPERTPQAPSGGAAGTPSEGTAESASGGPSAPAAKAPSRTAAKAAPKPRRLVPSRASDADLADLIVPLLADGEVSPTKIVKVIREKTGGASIGHDRAKRVLPIAEEQAKRVVPIGERKTS